MQLKPFLLTAAATAVSAAEPCSYVSADAVATSSGVFFNENTDPVNVAPGAAATEDGTFCEYCLLVSAGETATVSGMAWMAPGTDGIPVAAGDTAPADLMPVCLLLLTTTTTAPPPVRPRALLTIVPPR